MKWLLIALSLSGLAQAAKLSDFKPYNFEVLFTNPVCAEYKYDREMLAVDGTLLTAKPRNVYCKSTDFQNSAMRESSPQYRLLEWIKLPTTKELFLTYLSFSNKDVAAALCDAAKRDVKITFVLDSAPDDESEGNSLAEGLKKCGDKVTIHYRGQRNGLGYAHNKIMMVNPEDKKEVRIVFSSGNMSPGTVIYHENWNFVTTNPASHFVQAHLCLREGMINHGDSRKEFSAFLNDCRSKIAVSEESDIQSFFVPAEGKKAFAALSALANKATRVEAAAHRFSGDFIRLFDGLIAGGKDVRLVTDDDMYWSWTLHRDTGRNTRMEAFKVEELKKKGLQMRFMETNHSQMYLQHNKFMVFELGNTDAVFAGAGNFTSAAFDKNYENFYVITVPEVVKAFQAQYSRFWNTMGTPQEKMPRQNVLP